jgi:hypothetical protein
MRNSGFTKGSRAHLVKLEYLYKVDDDWLANIAKGMGLGYKEIEKGILANTKASDMEEYRKGVAKRYFNFRLESLYVDYDFDKKEWVDPQKNSIINDPVICLQGLIRAKHMLQILRALLFRKEKEKKE